VWRKSELSFPFKCPQSLDTVADPNHFAAAHQEVLCGTATTGRHKALFRRTNNCKESTLVASLLLLWFFFFTPYWRRCHCQRTALSHLLGMEASAVPEEFRCVPRSVIVYTGCSRNIRHHLMARSVYAVQRSCVIMGTWTRVFATSIRVMTVHYVELTAVSPTSSADEVNSNHFRLKTPATLVIPDIACHIWACTFC
jgi:hypothetical protein